MLLRRLFHVQQQIFIVSELYFMVIIFYNDNIQVEEAYKFFVRS